MVSVYSVGWLLLLSRRVQLKGRLIEGLVLEAHLLLGNGPEHLGGVVVQSVGRHATYEDAPHETVEENGRVANRRYGAVFKVEAAAVLQLGRQTRPESGRGRLLGRLEARVAHVRLAVGREEAETTLVVVAHVALEVTRHDAGHDRERVDALVGKVPVEGHREESVGRLRLAVGFPGLQSVS